MTDELVIFAIRAAAAVVWVVILIRVSDRDPFRLRRAICVGSLALLLAVIAIGGPLVALGVEGWIVRGMYSMAAAIILIAGIALLDN